MGFLRVDKARVQRRGAVYVVQIGGKTGKMVIGRTQSDNKVSALLAVAADQIEKGWLPELRVVKFKKVTDTYVKEALLHSYLAAYAGEGDSYHVPVDELSKYWKEL